MSTDNDSMARPVRVFTAKGLATRARIIAAAAEIVSEQGVAATAIEDVRKEAGVSGSQLYHYFNDKRELIQAVVAYQAQAAVELQAPLGRLDSIEAFRAWADFHIELQEQRQCAGGCRLGSLVPQVAEADSQARAVLGAGFTSWEQPLIDGLRAMQNRGELQPHADPEQLGTALLAALQGGLLLTQAQRSVAPLKMALGAAIDHLRCLVPSGASARRAPKQH
ncbi:TetR/AcrR family transcriptional regulator [Actinomadura sp. DC4]|uniref:TetR/AcrR family transcriptional regulator n=1 Tax=Actinomadura sp. DC4 TaxID=3055069 RepID=UPI0025B0B14E|nr:TetR/AcrR family transcriptional regulator [Actinomadura sp. DC4]MDN3359498.1 TetR family transcriptional regulator [Actinomadura sp. DC4]